MEPLDQALRLRVPGPADIHPRPPACRGMPGIPRSARRGPRATDRSRLPRPTPASAAPAASASISCHHSADRSSAHREGTSRPEAHREYPHTIVSTGSCFAGRTCPNPTGTCVGGNRKSHCAISPAAYNVRDAGSGGRYAGRHSATFPLSVRIEYGHPIRSAITVDGIGGNA